jgi:hypothetical protein
MSDGNLITSALPRRLPSEEDVKALLRKHGVSTGHVKEWLAEAQSHGGIPDRFTYSNPHSSSGARTTKLRLSALKLLGVLLHLTVEQVRPLALLLPLLSPSCLGFPPPSTAVRSAQQQLNHVHLTADSLSRHRRGLAAASSAPVWL